MHYACAIDNTISKLKCDADRQSIDMFTKSLTINEFRRGWRPHHAKFGGWGTRAWDTSFFSSREALSTPKF